MGLGGKASKNNLKDASFIFSMTNVTMTNVTILSIFLTHAKKEYRKVLEMKGTYILIDTGVYLLDFFCSGIQFNLLSLSLLYLLVNLDLYVLGDDALIS